MIFSTLDSKSLIIISVDLLKVNSAAIGRIVNTISWQTNGGIADKHWSMWVQVTIFTGVMTEGVRTPKGRRRIDFINLKHWSGKPYYDNDNIIIQSISLQIVHAQTFWPI